MIWALLVPLQQFVIGADTGLRLRLAGARARRDPLALAVQRPLAGCLLAALLGHALGLLLEVGRVVALVGNAAAAVELENPAGDVVEEVAVVGDDQHRPRELAEVLLEPGHRLGVEVVGGLVEEDEVGRREKELAERDAALLAARELAHVGIAGRAAERVHRHLDLRFEVPEVLAVDLVLELGALLRRLVGVVHHQFVVAVEDRLLLGDALHDVAEHVLRRVELRLLRQVADGGAIGEPGVAAELLVDAGHDAEQRRLARAVRAEDADLGVRVEGEVDVLEDLLAPGIGLGQALHVIDELARHDDLRRAAVGRGRLASWLERDRRRSLRDRGRRAQDPGSGVAGGGAARRVQPV